MSLTFQIIMAFAIVLVALVIAAVFLKKTRAVWIIAAAFMVPAAVVTTIAANYVAGNPADELLQAKLTEEKDDNPADYIDIAASLLAKGMTKSADRVLGEYVSRYPINAEYLLTRARLDALRGNYDSAYGIMNALKSSGDINSSRIEDEFQALENAMQGLVSHNELVQAVLKGIDSASLPENAVRTAEVYAKVDRMDASRASVSDAADAAAEYEKILQDYPDTAFPPTIETSYLKALELSEQYPKIVARSDKYTDSHQYLMLGEVVREKNVTERDLQEVNVLSEQRKRNQRIIDWIEKQRASHDFGEDSSVIDEALEKLHDSSTDSVESYEAWVREQMRNAADDPTEREASKLYLELAYMNYTAGNDEETAALIRKALSTASNSEDSAYLQPAGKLNEILENKEDTESFKKIENYVNVLVDNMQAEEMKANSGVDMNVDLSDFAGEVTDNLTGDDDGYDSSYDNGSSDTSNDSGSRDGDSEDGSSGDADSDGFSKHVSEQVNQITASINIASIDHSKFEEVSAVIAIDESVADTAEAFKEKIDLFDCDIAIKDYQVEKLSDAGVNIILVCDNSGSMGDYNKIDDLKNALLKFADNLDGDTKAGIVAFSSGYQDKGSTLLGSAGQQLKTAINEMEASGGTNIYSGVEKALEQFQPGDSINVMIVMSDGQDDTPSESRLQELKAACADRDVMIYSMGLGSDVDSAVLSAYSAAGGGSYTFVSDADSLLSFYNYLYKISRNRFRVTYTAEDTIQTDRMLRAEYRDDTKVFDTKEYKLYDNSDLDGDNVGEQYSVALEGVTVGGLDTRLLYKSTLDQTVHLLGSELKQDLDIKVSIKSGMTYDLDCAYESDSSWRVTVPASASCGEYDVVVTVNGKRAVFQSGLVITSDQLNVVRFGQYVFEASTVGSAGDETTLSGFVRMNGWLSFTGNVTLKGDLKHADSITMDAARSYVRYKSGDSDLNLMAKFMADHGFVVSLQRFFDLKLFRNDNVAPSDENFRVEPVVAFSGLVLQNVFELNAPGISLYPDRAVIDFNEFSTKFPFQDKLLESGGLDKIFKFDLEHKEQLMVSQKAVDCAFELKVGSTDKKEYSEVPMSNNKKINAFFGNFRLLANLDEFNLKINTAEQNYSFKIAVNIAMIGDGLGFELAWKDGKFDTANIFADIDVNAVIGGVPTTFSDFKLGASGISGAASGKLSDLELHGGADVSFLKVSSFLPGLEDYIGDVSVFSLDDVNFKIRFGEFSIHLGATLKFLENVELGSASLDMGSGISYTNEMLHYDGESVNGIIGKIEKGFKIDEDNIKLDIGSTGELALTNKVMGGTAGGHCHYDIHWWIIGKQDDFEGKMFAGCYQKHNGKMAFALIFRLNTTELARFEWDVDKVIA